MLEELTNLIGSPISWQDALLPMGISLVAAVIVYLMYQIFYGSKHIGAGVHRTFLVGGPAITMIFLAIQSSIALGLGMLGALSFVRFRTPVKDPAEIGFLLLLIACSIGTATSNYMLTGLLLLVVFVTLGVQRLANSRFNLFGRGHLMISIDQTSYPTLEKPLNAFLGERLRGLNLETMSTTDERVSLHYQYRKQPNFDWAAFNNQLEQLSGTAKVEVFIG